MRSRVLLLIVLVAFGVHGPEVAAQSPTLREIFEEAAAAIRFGTVQQPFEDDAEPASGAAADAPLPSGARGSAMSADQREGETLPPPRLEGKLPLAGDAAGEVRMSESNGRITLVVRDASLSRVLALLAQTQGLNIVASNDIDALISITLHDVPLEEALTAILSVANYTWVKRGEIILVTSLAGAVNLPADVQGRQIQVFDLDFASASTVAEAVSGFLSPIGKVSISQSDPADNRMTRERVIVEDLPDSLSRIAAFICQMDQAPHQVLIEAHILQINLDDTNEHGVDLGGLLRVANAEVSIQPTDVTALSTAFATTAPRALVATLNGSDLKSVVQLLQTTTDAKSLGTPKLLVLNEQEAQFQVGEKLGYKTTTTTETSSMETVQFLNVGVVLTVTPRITRDGRVLMHVSPKVSTGDVVNDVPNEQTTELHTDVMLEDGQGMIIGGLIKETDSVTQSKIPYLGNVKGIGWLFRHSEVVKSRVEIIVALVPRIQPYDAEWQAFEQGELVRAGVPLLHGPLCRTDRPWDPVLPDGKRVAKPLLPKRHARRPRGYYHGLGPQYVVPPYPLPKQQFYGMPCEHPDNVMISDEVLPMPEFGDSATDAVEIITDKK